MTTLERLEEWVYGHKARWFELGRDNGYGATCWELKSESENGGFAYSEAQFMNEEDDWLGLDKFLSLALDKLESKR